MVHSPSPGAIALKMNCRSGKETLIDIPLDQAESRQRGDQDSRIRQTNRPCWIRNGKSEPPYQPGSA